MLAAQDFFSSLPIHSHKRWVYFLEQSMGVGNHSLELPRNNISTSWFHRFPLFFPTLPPISALSVSPLVTNDISIGNPTLLVKSMLVSTMMDFSGCSHSLTTHAWSGCPLWEGFPWCSDIFWSHLLHGQIFSSIRYLTLSFCRPIVLIDFALPSPTIVSWSVNSPTYSNNLSLSG